MLITGIKSKPVYTPLAPDTGGRQHLLVGHGVGGEPLLRLVNALGEGAGSGRDSRRLLYVGGGVVAPEAVAAVRAADVADVRVLEETPALLASFRAVLESSVMGLRLYVAGQSPRSVRAVAPLERGHQSAARSTSWPRSPGGGIGRERGNE